MLYKACSAMSSGDGQMCSNSCRQVHKAITWSTQLPGWSNAVPCAVKVLCSAPTVSNGRLPNWQCQCPHVIPTASMCSYLAGQTSTPVHLFQLVISISPYQHVVNRLRQLRPNQPFVRGFVVNAPECSKTNKKQARVHCLNALLSIIQIPAVEGCEHTTVAVACQHKTARPQLLPNSTLPQPCDTPRC